MHPLDFRKALAYSRYGLDGHDSLSQVEDLIDSALDSDLYGDKLVAIFRERTCLSSKGPRVAKCQSGR
jgi:hypothetical protein